jgi:hypothetical protein
VERKDILNLQKLCLSYNNFLAFSCAAELLKVKYDNLYKFFRSGMADGMFTLDVVDGVRFIKSIHPVLDLRDIDIDKLRCKCEERLKLSRGLQRNIMRERMRLRFERTRNGVKK